MDWRQHGCWVISICAALGLCASKIDAWCIPKQVMKRVIKLAEPCLACVCLCNVGFLGVGPSFFTNNSYSAVKH